MTREEAMQILSNMIHDDIAVYGHKDKPRNIALDMAIEALEEQRQHGEWIKQFDVKTQYYTCTCSVCGDTHRLLINYFLESNFCPNCGSPMNEKALEILRKRNEREGEAE